MGNRISENTETEDSNKFPKISTSAGKWVLVATILGSSMAFIDSTAMNVILPVLQRELGATIPQVQWIIESYALFMSSLMLLGGALGDKYGRRLIFAIGIVLFTASSIWCGLSQNTSQLIIARGFQGVGGALLVPGSLAIVTVFFDERERGRAIGTWSAFTAITTALGPILGGWLSENLSWRYVFFINVPIAFVVLATLYMRIPESSKDDNGGRLDWLGSIFAILGLGGIVFGLIDSANIGFSHPKVVISFIIGAVGLIAFIITEYRTPNPMMPLSLFRSKAFSGANLLTLLYWGAWGSAIFFIPFNLIQLQGYSAAGVGVAFLPLILALFLFSRWAGGLVVRYGAKMPLVIGTLITAVGYYVFTIPGIGGSYWIEFLPAISILGVGMSITIAPLTTAVMSSIDVEYSGIASGINNSVGRIAGLLAIAVLGVFALSVFNKALDRELVPIEIGVETREIIDQQRIKLAGIEIPEHIEEPTRTRLVDAVKSSFLASFRVMMYVSCVLSGLSAVIAWFSFTRRGKKSIA